MPIYDILPLLNKSFNSYYRYHHEDYVVILAAGILVAKKKLLSNKTPHSCGGGTVFFVTPTDHRYFKEEEVREEGGTPAILGSVRAGLAIQLKEAVGTEWIMAREEELCRRVFREWESISELIVVGPHSIPRLPVFSFLIWHPATGRFLHHNYVCTLLNDLFGVQVRGGCSCAGPYAQVGSCTACSTDINFNTKNNNLIVLINPIIEVAF